MAMDLSSWSEPLCAYADWLQVRSQFALEHWARHLNSADDGQVEGAVGEAAMWDYLVACLDLTDELQRVDLCDTGGKSAPDLRFETTNGSFCLEITNISKQAATDCTGLVEDELGFRFYRPITAAVANKVKSKAGKGWHLNEPLVIGVTTLHADTTMTCIDDAHAEFMVTGIPFLQTPWDSRTGDTVGNIREVTKLQPTVFDDHGVGAVHRGHVSGVILAGFPGRSAKAVGALNHRATHPLSPFSIPFISFCERRIVHIDGVIGCEAAWHQQTKLLPKGQLQNPEDEAEFKRLVARMQQRRENARTA